VTVRKEGRELAVAVLVCAVAAGLALYTASRAWVIEVIARPAPLPATTVSRTGGSLVPAIPALALVGLAAAGALLATRGRGRIVVGVLLLLCGLGLVVGAAYAVAGPERVGVAWPVASMVCGGLVAAVGFRVVGRGPRWPSLGGRYERAGGSAAPTSSSRATSSDDAALWDAIDRGEDPTET
jgi:hypothetical protein